MSADGNVATGAAPNGHDTLQLAVGAPLVTTSTTLTAPTPATPASASASVQPAQQARRPSQVSVALTPPGSDNPVIVALKTWLLYGRSLGKGRHAITCPWNREHVDVLGDADDETAIYLEPTINFPAGAFRCRDACHRGKNLIDLLRHVQVDMFEARHLPIIRVEAGSLGQIVNAAELVLARRGDHYQRGGVVVKLTNDPDTRKTSIRAAGSNELVRDLANVSTWQRFSPRSMCDVLIDPPKKYVDTLIDISDYKHLPLLRGVARQPYMRADGSIVAVAGYDPESAMYGAFNPDEFRISARPTRRAAEAALKVLSSLLSEFPFKSERDKSAAIAMMLTAVIRPSLPLAPMGHVKAPQIASGKSYLTALIGTLAGPEAPSAYAMPSNDEECQKLLLSALLEAPTAIVFDNMTTDLMPLKSLCSALTETALTGRILGVSKTATVPTRTLFMSSGNNVDAVRDMTRRVLTITLEPGVENPAERSFKRDPLRELSRDRGRFVSAALTIVLAWRRHRGQRPTVRPLGSYTDWTENVRLPLVWLGLPDPAESMFDQMMADPDRELLGGMLSALRKQFGGGTFLARDVIRATEGSNPSPELPDLVQEVAGERGGINSRKFGRWLARHRDRPVAGLRLVHDGTSHGTERWLVQPNDDDRVVGVVK